MAEHKLVNLHKSLPIFFFIAKKLKKHDLLKNRRMLREPY